MARWDERLALYDRWVDRCPRFERKGKTVPYTSANGHMFSLMNKECQLGIRFSKEVQLRYLEKYQTTLFYSHNAVMQGYILLTESMLTDEDEMVKLLNEGFDYVMSLDPK